MNKKLIIFDFDGTIADSMSAVISIVNSFSSKLSFEPVGENEIKELRDMTVKQLLQKKKISKWKFALIYWLGRRKFKEIVDKVKPFKGCCEVINKLKEKKYSLGIITSNSEFSVKKFFEKNNINVFDFVVSANTLLGKGRIIKKILKKYNLLAKEAVYIGDEIRDLEAAKKAGVDSIAVGWGYNSEAILVENQPTHFANNPEQILSFFE